MPPGPWTPSPARLLARRAGRCGGLFALACLAIAASARPAEATSLVATSTAASATITASRAPDGPPPPVRDESTERVEISGAPGKGLTVRTGDAFAVTLRSRIQLRETFSEVTSTTHELNVKTLRLITQGHVLSPDLRFTIQLAFGPGDYEASSPTPIFDAFVEYLGIRDLNVRVGQYFVPFDRARTIREFALHLVDRQQVVTELNLDRDVGITFSSQDLFGLDGRLAYALSLFGGSGRNRVTPDPVGFLYAARLGYRPFGPFDDDSEGDLTRAPKPRLAIGVAGAYNHKATRPRSSIGTPYAIATFDYTHAAADVVFKWSGFSFLGEALYRHAPTPFRDGVANGQPVREWSRSAWGYLLQAGMMLTQRIEVVGRWDQLRAIGETDPALVRLVGDQGREVGAGVNLYLNGHFFKVQGDYAARFGTTPAPTNHLFRLQLDATF